MNKQEQLELAKRHEKTGEWEWAQGNFSGANQHYAKAAAIRESIQSTVVQPAK